MMPAASCHLIIVQWCPSVGPAYQLSKMKPRVHTIARAVFNVRLKPGLSPEQQCITIVAVRAMIVPVAAVEI